MASIKRFSEHFKKYPNVYLSIILMVFMFALRFIDLSYSDYISDEPGTFFYRGGKKTPELSITEFILDQRKGPLQLFIGYIPFTIMGNYENELVQRIPFALFNLFSIYIFFRLVSKLTKSNFIAFMSAFLFGVNGLVVAYGRIAQYESLNMFFSFAALYYYADLLESSDKHLKSSVLGSFFLGLSFLAHWDAVYILIPVLFIFARYFLNKGIRISAKLKLLGVNFLAGAVVLLPFLIPYLFTLTGNADNSEYAEKILGWGDSLKNRADMFQFQLYNPFLTFYLYAVLGIAGIFFSRKNPIFSFWFITVMLVFRFFVSYSGLHFYNIFPPVVVLVSYTLNFFIQSSWKFIKHPAYLLSFTILGFLFMQSYLLFVEHRTEYPFEQEKILFWKTNKYTNEQEMRHKTGFPHKRYWSEINRYLNEQNKLNGESYGYITNEYKPHARFYMDLDYREHGGFYAVGIKKPLSFANDYKFSQLKNKEKVHEIKNEYGETVVRIYRVDEKEDD